jgi:hypothetical protein
MLLRWTSVGCAVSTGIRQPREKRGDLPPVDAGFREKLERSVEHAAFALGTKKAELAHLLLILGEIREVQEVTERPHDAHTVVAPELLELPAELPRILDAAVSAKLGRGLADAFDRIKKAIAFEVTDHVAEQSAQLADVLALRCLQPVRN